MFTANQTFKSHAMAMRILKRYLCCRKDCDFRVTSPARRNEQSLACWVKLSPVTDRWEVHFRSNRIGVCDFRECETFNRFIDLKMQAKLEKKPRKNRTDSEESLLVALVTNRKEWEYLMNTKKHVTEQRVTIMQQLVENQQPLSRNALHPGGNVDGLMEKLFGVKS